MIALELIIALVAVVWAGVAALRGGLLGASLMVMAAGIWFSSPFFSFPLGPVVLTLDRVLWLALLVQYVVWRRLGMAEPKPLGSAEIALLAFIGVLLANTLIHDTHISRDQPLVRLGLFYVMPLGVYWIARQTRLTERSVRVMFALAAAAGIYMAVTAWAETHQLWWLVYPGYIASPNLGEYFGRGRGPLLNPAACGMFQTLGLAALLMWWPRTGRPEKLLLLAGCVLMAVGIYSTLTRSAWLGAGLGLTVLLAFTVPRAWRAALWAFVLLLAALLAATQWDHLLAFKRDRDLPAEQTAESARLRPLLAIVAWHMFLDHPVAGCGFGQYLRESPPYCADRSTSLPLERARPFVQHNVLLNLLVETGILGAGLFALVLALWARDAWRLCSSSAAPAWVRQQAVVFLVLLVAYLANGMFQDVSLIHMVNMLLFFMAGLTASLRHLAEPSPTPESL